MSAHRSLFVLLFALASPVSFAGTGTSDGGGGAGVRCVNTGSNDSLELLDLHEIRVRREPLVDSPANMDEAIDLVSFKLGTHYYMPTSDKPSSWYINYLKKNLVEKIFKGQPFTNPLNGNTVTIEFVKDLPLAEDLGDYQIRPGCSLEQVAFYSDPANILKIVTARWNELSWIDRAALVSHEIQYFLDRFNGLEDFGSNRPKTSARTRHFVGMLYTRAGIEPKYGAIPQTGTYSCASNADPNNRKTWFTVFSTATDEFTAVFESIQGYSSAYATSAVFSENNVGDLTDWFDGEFEAEKNLHVATSESLPSFSVKLTKDRHDGPKLQVFIEEGGVKTPLASEEEIICWDPN